MDDTARTGSSNRSDRQSIPGIGLLQVTNEDWRGKKDPKERRRIQNRLNQRARRQRQRAMKSRDDSSSRVTPASSITPASSSASHDDTRVISSNASDAAIDQTPTVPTTSRREEHRRSTDEPDDTRGDDWDELGRLINVNFMAAAASNAARLGLDPTLLQRTTPSYTPHIRGTDIPPLLLPLPAQHTIPHDLIFDVIPHPLFRSNILKAITAGEIDSDRLSRAIRGSGAVQTSGGPTRRSGLVVWSDPERIASWELSDTLVESFPSLLRHCETLLMASNVWRERRGQRPFPLSLCQELPPASSIPRDG